MGIKKPDTSTMTIRGAMQQLKRETLDLNHRIQRRNVWKINQCQLLISSILENVKIPGIVIIEEDGIRYAIDGKQRITTATDFFENKFCLSDNVDFFEDIDFEELESEEPITIQDIIGRKYEELPQAIKNKLQKFEFKLDVYKDLTDKQIRKLYKRYNGGTLLTKMELTKADISTDIINFIKEISSREFFQSKVAISDSQRNRYVDEEVILQIISILMNGYNEGFSGKELNKLALSLEENGIPENIRTIIKDTTEYLDKAIPIKEKFMKKLNIPMVFYISQRAINDDVEPLKFGGFLQDFFANIPNEYFLATQSGSAKKENIKDRIDSMSQYYDENIKTAKEFVMPEVKPQSTKKKGRPSKVESTQNNPQEDPIGMAASENGSQS
jgi:hypothetical protein